MCLSFYIDIASVNLVERIGRGRREKTVLWTATVGVEDVGSYFCLDGRGQEISLDCGNACWWLDWKDVYAYYAPVGCSATYCYLECTLGHGDGCWDGTWRNLPGTMSLAHSPVAVSEQRDTREMER
jgi:hypothetical protein